ncbi:uncharacterized protein LY79DRAFT_574619 [Colletotrichum navitas]|uniref:Uncharacterized protein n=1 Tax=Colletotrichum navitas TaxID=681940 RepID=A0AAD8VCQ1_9PEZI|nr:uncharacterized protein LY79DRAFT_574619 [Colletotrichum navitas]KAK1600276.1 hypothetical protein LY79DRAFT_574619 [Colletotrichum navitas]
MPRSTASVSLFRRHPEPWDRLGLYGLLLRDEKENKELGQYAHGVIVASMDIHREQCPGRKVFRAWIIRFQIPFMHTPRIPALSQTTETGGFQELPGTSPRPQNRRLRGGQSLRPINYRDVVKSRNRGLRRKDLVTQPLKPLVTSHQPPHTSRNLVVHRRMPACASVFVAPKNEPGFLSRMSTFRSANKLDQPLPSSSSPDQPVGFSFDIQELTHRPLPEGLGMAASPCPTFLSIRA